MSSVDLSRAAWRKSRRSSSSGNCVEVAAIDHVFAVRDSKNTEGTPLLFSREDWKSIVGAVKRGAFDL